MSSHFHLRRVLSAAGVMLVTASASAHAQPLAQRVRAVRDGTIELRYASRPGICGDGLHYFSLGRSMHVGGGVTVHGGESAYDSCLPGPVRVRLQAEQGIARVVRVDVGPVRALESSGGVTDLGVVSPVAAADYFLELAAAGSGSSKAVTAAVLADSASVWRRLLAIARDSGARGRSTRHEAAFWLAQFSAAKLDGRGESLLFDDDDDRDDPRSSAIFALSQLRNREGIEPLLQIARTNRDARLRRKALFWLGESVDPRAITLFGEIMGG